MAVLQELKTYRIKLLQMFLQDQELVELIANDKNITTPALNLQYTQVFPYLWVDKTVSEKKTFLCLSISAKAQAGSVKKDIAIHIWVFTHKDIVRMSNSIRTDEIACRIDALLNGNEDMGVSDVEFISLTDLLSLPDNYTGFYLQYRVKDINRLCRNV